MKRSPQTKLHPHLSQVGLFGQPSFHMSPQRGKLSITWLHSFFYSKGPGETSQRSLQKRRVCGCNPRSKGQGSPCLDNRNISLRFLQVSCSRSDPWFRRTFVVSFCVGASHGDVYPELWQDARETTSKMAHCIVGAASLLFLTKSWSSGTWRSPIAHLNLFLRRSLGVDVLVDRRGVSRLEVQGRFRAARSNRSLWLWIERVANDLVNSILPCKADGSERSHAMLVAEQVIVRVLCLPQHDQLKLIHFELSTQQPRS